MKLDKFITKLLKKQGIIEKINKKIQSNTLKDCKMHKKDWRYGKKYAIII